MKAKKPRSLRQPKEVNESSGSEEEQTAEMIPEDTNDSAFVAEAIRKLQKLRKRPAGISLSALATGKAVLEHNLTISNDPFRLKTGGMVDMRAISGSRRGEEDDDVEARLAKTFATETNKLDEDAEMIKYIEEELAKRKGLVQTPSPEQERDSDLLRDVPDYLRPAIGQQKEDMLSNQMLCGIPEVDLGVEAKMKNIEATEEAKQILLKKRFTGKHGQAGDAMVPTNIAVNFVQHSRWNNYTSVSVDRAELENKRELLNISALEKSTVEANNLTSNKTDARRLDAERKRLQAERATDNIVLQRFKNYARDRRLR